MTKPNNINSLEEIDSQLAKLEGLYMNRKGNIIGDGGEGWYVKREQAVTLFKTLIPTHEQQAVRQFAAWYASKAPKHRQAYIIEVADKWCKEFLEENPSA